MLEQVLSRFQAIGARAYVVGSQESEPEEIQKESYEKPAGSQVPDSFRQPGSFYLGIKESYALWAKNHGPNRYARLFDKFTKERPSYRIRIPIPSNIKHEGREERPFSALEADVVDIFHGTQYSDINFSSLTVFDTKNKRSVSLMKALDELNRTERSTKLEQLREEDRVAMLKELKFNTNLPAVPEDRNSPKRFDPRFTEFPETKHTRELNPKEAGQIRSLIQAIGIGQPMQKPGQVPTKWPSEATQVFEKAYKEAHALMGQPKAAAKLAKLKKSLEAYLAKNKTHDRSVSMVDAKKKSEDVKRLGELRKKLDGLESSHPDPVAREKAHADIQKELLKIQTRQQSGDYSRDLFDREVDDLLKVTFIDKLKDKIAEDDARNPRAQQKAAGQAGYELVVSRYPTDVLHMSTSRHWDSKSCMRLQWSKAGSSSPSSHVYKAIEHGGLVVYGCPKGDMNLDNPVCRTLLFPFQNVQDKDDIVLMPISRVYRGEGGLIPPNFLRTLYKLLDAFNDGNKGGQYSVFQRGFYTGDLLRPGGVDMPAIKVGSESEQKLRHKETLASMGVTKYTVRPDGKIDIHQDVTVREGAGIAEGEISLPIGRVEGNFCVSSATMRGGRNQMRTMEDDGFKPYPDDEGKAAGYEVWKKEYANSPSGLGQTGAAIGLSTCMGFPEYVKGDLRIRGSALINLEGANNTTVDGNVILECMPNLQNLNGFPKSVGKDVVVARAAKLQSLSGLDGVNVPGNLMIIHTNIRFIDAKPVVGKSWCLSGNFLRTTVGLPEEINGDLVLSGNRQLRDLKDFPRIIRGSCWISKCTLHNLKGVDGAHIEKNFFINGLGLATLEYFPAYVGGTCQCSENRLPGNTEIPDACQGKFVMGVGFDEVEDKAERKALYERAGANVRRDLKDQRYYNQFHPDAEDFQSTNDESSQEARERAMQEDKDLREKEIAGESSSNYKNGDIHLGVYKHPEEGMGVD